MRRTVLTAMLLHQLSMILRTLPSAVCRVALMSSMRMPARLPARPAAWLATTAMAA